MVCKTLKQTEKNNTSRLEIIQAAIAEFSSYGPEKMSLNQMCRTHNISKGRLYHHFASKNDIFCACVSYVMEQFVADLVQFEVRPDQSFQENLHNYYVSRIHYWMKFPDHYNMVKLAINNTNTEISKCIRPSIKKYDDAVLNKLVEILRYGKLLQWLNDENLSHGLTNIVRVMNEGLFFPDISRIVNAVRQGRDDVAKQRKDDLIQLYDRFIDTILYGVLPRQ